MWKFNYFRDEYSGEFEVTEPIEGATWTIVETEDEAIAKVAELNEGLVEYLLTMSQLEGWKDYFTE